ncbi:MAG: hypothetical protein M0P19_05940 [Nevskia sp.]|jgi:flagellar basal-body rod modification protein FlgD|nr:hypothetical protein [Nevskia sp.]MCK9383357.1 hypothetical protein [Nevskia sp.]
MAVDTIGSSVGSGVGQVQRNGLQQQDFLRLFLTQLSFQDPLNPVDNREFLAQLAQFANIQQTQVLSDNIQGLLAVQSVSQSVGLIGRTVSVTQNNQTLTGQVTTIRYDTGQPLLTLLQADGTSIQNVRLAQIVLVR